MCNFTRLSHACTHTSYKLNSACPHSLNSASKEPGTCGRMNIISRRTVGSLCSSCNVLRDRQIGMMTSRKVQNWMDDCRGAMNEVDGSGGMAVGDEWRGVGNEGTV